jgi:hypothetical protein
MSDHDPFLDLLERFAARGVDLKPGNTTLDMIRHLLDVVEEQDVRIRALEDGYRRLKGEQALLSGQAKGEPKIGEIGGETG